MFKKIKKKKGSVTVEYMITVGAIIGVLVAFFRPSGPFQNTTNQVLTGATYGDLTSVTGIEMMGQGCFGGMCPGDNIPKGGFYTPIASDVMLSSPEDVNTSSTN